MGKKDLNFDYWSAARGFSAFQLMSVIPEPNGQYCYDPKTAQIVKSLKRFIESWKQLNPNLEFSLALGGELFMQKLFIEELFSDPWGMVLLHSASAQFGDGTFIKVPDFLLPTQCLYCAKEMKFKDTDVYAPSHEPKLTCDDTHKSYWNRLLKDFFKKPIEDICKAPIPECPQKNMEHLQQVAKNTFDSYALFLGEFIENPKRKYVPRFELIAAYRELDIDHEWFHKFYLGLPIQEKALPFLREGAFRKELSYFCDKNGNPLSSEKQRIDATHKSFYQFQQDLLTPEDVLKKQLKKACPSP